MANSNSPLFVPPMSRTPEEDSMLVRVPLDKVPHGARRSQTSAPWDNKDLSPKHITNGR